MKSQVLKLVPKRLKASLKGLSKKNQLNQRLATAMPALTCVDVGASYYPHGKWRLFLESKKTNWIAVEPNKQNLSYMDSWGWPCRISACTIGLSDGGGRKTLYVTATDSGSSLLEPVINAEAKHRVRNLDYFFPLKKIEIDTITLNEAIETGAKGASDPVFVKLDTQGTELSILKGADDLFKANRIVGIEMESTLAADPVMSGSGRLWEAMQYLESKNLELLDITPIAMPSRYQVKKNKGKTYFNECDAVFAMKRTTAQRLGNPYKLALLGFYVCYQFYEEALTFLEDDRELATALGEAGVQPNDLKRLLMAAL